MKLWMTKGMGGALYPANEESIEALKKIPLNEWVHIQLVRPRNVKFHRKFFAMLHVGFEAWEPKVEDYKGLPVQKNFERFREDVVIAAGFYDVVPNIKGEVRAIAKSISFAKMEEEEFEKVYSRVLDVLLQYILKGYNREDVDEIVDHMLSFA